MRTTPFKPGEKVTVKYEMAESVWNQRGFFLMMDETGVLLQGRTGQAKTIYIPGSRLVMIESEQAAV